MYLKNIFAYHTISVYMNINIKFHCLVLGLIVGVHNTPVLLEFTLKLKMKKKKKKMNNNASIHNNPHTNIIRCMVYL